MTIQWRRYTWLIVVAGIVLPILILGGIVFAYYTSWAMSFNLDKVTTMPSATLVYDRYGYVIQRLFEENRIPVSKKEIPDVLKQAVVATEDQRFYYHMGFDPFGILRAAINNFLGKRIASGASTITQQLARNSAQMFERTVDRKLKEIFLAIRLEAKFSKDEILALYLNRIFFGKNVYGIGAAAQSYFGKSPQDLNLSESAMLAGIISGPNSFSPWRSPARAKQARARALERMVSQKYITQEQADACNKQQLILRPLLELPGSHAISIIWDDLPGYLSRDMMLKGGLRIYTTIDWAFQQAAEKQLEKSLQAIEARGNYPHMTRAKFLKTHSAGEEDIQTLYLQGAFVAIHNPTGGILAMVGSRNFEESPFNRAVEAKRQVGSTLKPFIYAHLFRKLNATAFTEVNAAEFDLHNPEKAFDPDGGTKWISVREAIETSDNFAAMRAGLAGGLEGFVELVKEATDEELPPFPSSTLGATGVSPLQLTKAFSIFPNKGVLIRPHVITRIETSDGYTLYQHEQIRKPVLSPEVSFQIHDILRGVVDNGTAGRLRWESKLEGEIAGKTGTTDEYKDSWFVGYTTEMTAGVWVGLDQPQTIFPNAYSNLVAVPVWGEIMKLANQYYEPQKFIPPPGVKKVLAQQKRKFLFFDTTETSDRPEYIREDQWNNALSRVAHANMELPSTSFFVMEQEEGQPKREERDSSFSGWFRRVTGIFSGDEEEERAGEEAHPVQGEGEVDEETPAESEETRRPSAFPPDRRFTDPFSTATPESI